MVGAQSGQHALPEPQDGVLVWPVTHVAGEGDDRAALPERARKTKLRRKVAAVHAVRDHQRHLPGGGNQFLEQLRLGWRDEQAVVTPPHRVAIEGAQAQALPSIQPRQWPAVVTRHLAPLLGVHVDEIDDAPQAMRGHAREELRHGRRVREDAVDRPALHEIGDPAGERGITQNRDAQGFAACKRAQSASPDAASRQGAEMTFAAQGPQVVGMLPVARVVDKARQVHQVRTGEV